MAKPSIEEHIQARIQAFAEELSELVRAAALEAVEQVLGGRAASSMRVPLKSAKPVGRPRGKGKGKRIRRTAAALEQDMEQLQAYVVAHPGLRLEEISVGMGVDSKNLKRPVTLLLAGKRLRKEGERRGTRYFASGTGGAAKRGTKTAKKRARKKVTRKSQAPRK